MKIAYIAASVVPSRTANSIHVMKMCQALALNGQETILMLPNKIDKNIKVNDVYDFYGVEKCFKIARFFTPNFHGGYPIFAILAVLGAKKEKVKIVYTRSIYACFFSLILGLPTILEIHSSVDSFPDKIFFKLINKRKLKKIVVISNALKRYFTESHSILEKIICVHPDGADPVSGNLKAKKIKNANYQMSVGYVGHLYKGRGIEIIAELAKQCPWAAFHIIGGMPEDVGYWKNKLSDLKNIMFYGHVPHKEVYQYMANFDALIAPYQENVSVFGGSNKKGGGGNTAKWMSPLKIFEYMASGKAILASDIPVLREILSHKKNSLLAPPKDISRWKENMEIIMANVELREKLGKNAKDDFEKSYTWKSRARKIIAEVKNS